MVSSAVLSSLHLLTLALGLGAVVARGRALRSVLDGAGLKALFLADNLWGIAAVMWIATGLLRAFGGFEKGTPYYLHNHMFHLKMGLFLLVFLLEIWPMATFIRWRIAQKRGKAIDFAKARTLWRVNHLEMWGLVAIVFVASLMARGIAY
jgi:putative membrane protein